MSHLTLKYEYGLTAPLDITGMFIDEKNIERASRIPSQEARTLHARFDEFTRHLNAGDAASMQMLIGSAESARGALELLAHLVSSLEQFTILYCCDALRFRDGSVGLVYTDRMEATVLVVLNAHGRILEIVTDWREATSELMDEVFQAANELPN